MSLDSCYIKTEAGRNELHARQMALAPRLRALLVMIDGRQRVSDYLKKLEGTGIGVESFIQLQELGLIQIMVPHAAPLSHPAAPSSSEAPLAEPAVQPDAVVEDSLKLQEHQQLQQLQQLQQRMQQIYVFYNTTIRDTIGLRGFMLQVDVERATTLDEYRALRERYVTAVNKAANPSVARLLIEELDKLLQ